MLILLKYTTIDNDSTMPVFYKLSSQSATILLTL